MRRHSAARFWLFLFGLGSATQVQFLGSIGISELVSYFVAPYLFVMDYHKLRAHGFLTFVFLVIFTCMGCVVSSKINGTPFIPMLKGLAVPYSYFAIVIVLHHLLCKDFSGYKWLFWGAFLSGIISIFVFQPAAATVRGGVMLTGAAATENMVSHPLFWSRKIKGVLNLPINVAYLSLPKWYVIGAALVGTFVTLLFSGSTGRSAAATGLAGVVFLAIGGKSSSAIKRLCKHFLLVAICGIVMLGAFKGLYSHLAKSGALGVESLEKYERQTIGGESILKMLMSGRMEFFCGVLAALDHPLVGFGPSPEDKGGYALNYLAKYGTFEDYEAYRKAVQNAYREGRPFQIPLHSYITFFWLSYGIVGFILWIYVLMLIFFYLRKYAPAIPQVFGMIAMSTPGMVWAIFFSPPGVRVGAMNFVVFILFCRAVYKKKFILPVEMQREIIKVERK